MDNVLSFSLFLNISGCVVGVGDLLWHGTSPSGQTQAFHVALNNDVSYGIEDNLNVLCVRGTCQMSVDLFFLVFALGYELFPDVVRSFIILVLSRILREAFSNKYNQKYHGSIHQIELWVFEIFEIISYPFNKSIERVFSKQKWVQRFFLFF